MSILKYLKPKQEKHSGNPFVVQTGRFGNAQSDTVYRTGWTEDTYVAAAKQKQETIGQNFETNKLLFIGSILLLFLLLLIGRVAWLQIGRGDYYYQMAEGNRIREEKIEPQRGIIYDRQMNVLVHNKANFMLYFVPVDLPTGAALDQLMNDVQKIVGTIDLTSVRQKLAGIKKNSLDAYQPLFVEDNIDYDKAMQLYLKSANWPGVVLSSKSNREYAYATLPDNNNPTAKASSTAQYSISLSHVMGYTGKINEDELKKYGNQYQPIDYIGKTGVEYFWENELRGVNGQKQIEVDALGKERQVINETDAVPGNGLVLTIDINQQIKLEQLLQQELDKIHLQKGVAVVMDPNNGEILAMVSLPAYNNNDFAKGISPQEYAALSKDPNQPLFNRVVSGEYPSGSTIKPILAAAALQEGVITANTTVLSTGGLRVGQWFFPDWKAGGHGVTDVRKALAWSINTFFYYIGGGYQNFQGLGPERMVHYEQLFGLGAQTGVDLPGEATGFLPTPAWKEKAKGEKWYIGDTYHISIGQGDLLVTPLQVAMYDCVFANGGTLYRPHLVKSIVDGATKEISDVKNDSVRTNFISPSNIEIVREGMRQTVTGGSAQRLQSVPVPVAGKTGTAQWSSDKNKLPHGWFIGFAPYDHPQIAIMIMIEAGGEGSTVATPIAQDFLTWYFSSYKAAITNNQDTRNK